MPWKCWYAKRKQRQHRFHGRRQSMEYNDPVWFSSLGGVNVDAVEGCQWVMTAGFRRLYWRDESTSSSSRAEADKFNVLGVEYNGVVSINEDADDWQENFAGGVVVLFPEPVMLFCIFVWEWVVALYIENWMVLRGCMKRSAGALLGAGWGSG